MCIRDSYLANWSGYSSCSWSPAIDTWYHVAVVRSGSTVTAYVDGTSIGTFTDLDMTSSNQMLIGAEDTTPNAVLNGWIDELRISKGTARYTANFTPPAKQFYH